MSQSDTKTRILDGAEQLFAREGFHNTSLREITGLAGVNLASVNYHFGSKDSLLHAVIERRLLPLNKVRQEKIEAVLAEAQNNSSLPNAEALLRAFIEPTLEFRNSSQGARDFISLIGRSLSEPDETVRNCFIDLALPVLRILFEALHQALPQLSPAILMARLQFIMGTMSHVMCMSGHSLLNNSELPPPLDHNTLVEQLIKFVLAGLEAPE
jgi:AcrR family transcriptional regulator